MYERIDRQVADASRQYGLPPRKLKFSIHIFKPDSAKLETVVAVDIGLQTRPNRLKSSIRAFYSPGLYGRLSAAKLEKEIHAYLKKSMG